MKVFLSSLLITGSLVVSADKSHGMGNHEGKRPRQDFESSETPPPKKATLAFSPEVQALINQGTLDKPIESDPKKDTPLIQASRMGDVNKVRELISAGATVTLHNIQNVNVTALQIAAQNGHREVAQLLIDGGADKEAKTPDGRTPLHIAAQNGHSQVAQLLIDRGADKEHKCQVGFTPLHAAAQFGKGNVAQLLIEKGADKEAKSQGGSTPLHFATRNGHIQVVQLLIEKGADVHARNNQGLSPYTIALTFESYALFNSLPNWKYHLDEKAHDGLTVLQRIINSQGLLGLKDLTALVDLGANIDIFNKEYQTPLLTVFKAGNYPLAKALVHLGAEINAPLDGNGTTLLTRAIQNQSLREIYTLLGLGADYKIKDATGRTPLDYAGEAFKPLLSALFAKHEEIWNLQPLRIKSFLQKWTGKEIPEDMKCATSGRIPFIPVRLKTLDSEGEDITATSLLFDYRSLLDCFAEGKEEVQSVTNRLDDDLVTICRIVPAHDVIAKIQSLGAVQKAPQKIEEDL